MGAPLWRSPTASAAILEIPETPDGVVLSRKTGLFLPEIRKELELR
jgi:hypothetical protein